MVFDLIVLGGGIAGISAAYLSVSSGLKTLLVEHGQGPIFSSVRNQGWLQSGALYALSNPYGETTAACKEGSDKIRDICARFDPECLGEKPGLMLFNTYAGLDQAYEQLTRSGISAHHLTMKEIRHSVGEIKLGPLYKAGLSIPDVVVNNARFLNLLHSLASSNGLKRVVSDDVHRDFRSIRRLNGNWSVTIGNTDIVSRNISLCLGPSIPYFAMNALSRLLPHHILNCYVIAIADMKVERLIISRVERSYSLNIAPFAGGVTMNCGSLDHRTDNVFDDSYPETYVLDTHSAIEEMIPNIIEYTSNSVSTYICQKLVLDRDGDRRMNFIAEIDEGFFVYYAGKFTMCISGAESFVRSVMSSNRGVGSQAIEAPDLQDVFRAAIHPGSSLPRSNLGRVLNGGTMGINVDRNL